jgi:hypothetical protein
MADQVTQRGRLATPRRPGGKQPNLTATPSTVAEGQQVVFTLDPSPTDALYGTSPLSYDWQVTFGAYAIPQSAITQDLNNPAIFTWDTTGVEPGIYNALVTATSSDATPITHTTPKTTVTVNLRPISRGDVLPVTMRRATEEPTSDAALWVVIRNSANALSFQNYLNFIDPIMCCPGTLDDTCSSDTVDKCALPPLSKRRALPFSDMDAYRILKIATECFLMMRCGVFITPQKLSELLTSSTYDLTEDSGRLNESVSGLPDTILNWWRVYLASGNQYLNLSQPPTPPEDEKLKDLTIPYLALVRSRLGDLAPRESYNLGIQCYGILRRKLTNPCLIELIWSYWQEEGMLVQTLNAVSRRFQNLRGLGDRDPLARFDIDPLRGLNSLLWGYIQDEQHRLTVRRRAYEYNHEYGLTLEGKAVGALRPSDGRSKFLEAFHNLLYLCTIFFKEDDDTTVVADGFPVLNALKEVHYILAAGAANQFGDLPSTARQEMLIQQWLLARPEMREFLGGKIMVPYPEEWMDRVDNVKTMFGWTDVSVIYFRDLAVYGEQIVLSIRYGAWSITNNPAQAANWARYWRPEIQAYAHAYRAATGVDLTAEPVNSTLPSVLLRNRLATQKPVAR